MSGFEYHAENIRARTIYLKLAAVAAASETLEPIPEPKKKMHFKPKRSNVIKSKRRKRK